MKRACEMCKAIARIYCESDQAGLCWNCDAKVHSANFLVARHSRNLLCRFCQSQTPWSASGSKLEPTFSMCRKCVYARVRNGRGEQGKEETVEEEIGENTVEPWPPPQLERSSSGEDADGDCEMVVSRKRNRLENDQPSDEDRDSLSSLLNIHTSPSDSEEHQLRRERSGARIR